MWYLLNRSPHQDFPSAMAAMSGLNRIWRCNTISFTSKFKLYKSLVTSILLHGCETWTLLADSPKKKKKKILAFETKCMRNLLPIYLEHKTNDCLWSQINFLVGPQESLLATVKETDTCMVRACHTLRQPIQNYPSEHLGRWATPWSADETLDGQHQRVDSPANARLVTTASCRKDWKRIFAESSVVSSRRPNRSWD